MKVSLHPAAGAELHEAADWYALEAGRLTASKFITDFEQARARILDNPRMGVAERAKARKIPFSHFPYSLIYRLGDGQILIVAVAHQSRRPGYWTGRR
ncbi:MAG: type II toxin-antitoxin system RelE/ParE family toxin [Hydrogenophilales bacterium]|nr:type II toxin-antitoxin system RelE/ParE family toxin [Hydrogenophilales bacterium]